jgi:predicted phosphodiesterase
MRLALLSDIHGNSIALDAVLRDVEARGGVDELWFLGDLAALGHDPVTVLQCINALPNAIAIRGNTDRYLVTGERPRPTIEDARADPAKVPVIAEVAASFGWTAGCLSADGWTAWLAGLPSEVRTTLPDGTRVLGVHASPGADEGPGINDDPEPELAARLAGCGADVVLAGHTHRPVDRRVGTTRAVNLGSVSNPVAPDLRASYVLIEGDRDGHTIEHVRVTYDHDAVVDALEALGHPGRAWLVAHQRGLVA